MPEKNKIKLLGITALVFAPILALFYCPCPLRIDARTDKQHGQLSTPSISGQSFCAVEHNHDESQNSSYTNNHHGAHKCACYIDAFQALAAPQRGHPASLAINGTADAILPVHSWSYHNIAVAYSQARLAPIAAPPYLLNCSFLC